jgi:ABC-type Fe3+/spermidine/putrescine transport system ATPase subunit
VTRSPLTALLSIRKSKQRARAMELLNLVNIAHTRDLNPRSQPLGVLKRLEVARALALDPSVLLLDEPLGALDRKLREDMQVELRRIQTSVGITFVYVTHDQEEALSMSDRIVVMRDGRIEQIGGTGEVYDTPESLWVADFVGASSRLTGTVAAAGESVRLQTDVAPIIAGWASPGVTVGQRAVAIVRPEAIEITLASAPVEQAPNQVRATVQEILNLGAQAKVVARTPGGTELVARGPRTGLDPAVRPGATVVMSFPATAVRVYAQDAAAGAAPEEAQSA